MTVLELKAEIEKKSEEEVSKTLKNAKEEAERILADVNRKISALRDEKTKVLTRELDTEERAELAISRMDRKGEILQQKLKWANRVFEEAGKRMAEMSRKGGPEYRELLAQLILEGIAKMKGNRFIVELSSRDSEAVRKQLKTILERAKKTKNEKIELQIRTLSTMGLGGVIISTQDMTQYYNNTLEARLSNARQNLSGEVYRMMFKRGE